MNVLKKNLHVLALINIILIIILGLAVGIHFKIPPFHIVKENIIGEKVNYDNKILDKEIKKELDKFWKNKILPEEVDKKYYREIFWAEKVRSGGYFLLFRHGEREKWGEALYGFDAVELHNKLDARNEPWYRATCLTERGIQTSININRVFKHANIKIQEVLSSPSCRARETAIFAFERIDEIHTALLHATAYHPLDRKKHGEYLKDLLLQKKIKKGYNIILSAHNSVVEKFPDFIDKIEIRPSLDETGFYVIENKDGKLIVRHKFEDSSTFNKLMFRFNPKGYKCVETKFRCSKH